MNYQLSLELKTLALRLVFMGFNFSLVSAGAISNPSRFMELLDATETDAPEFTVNI